MPALPAPDILPGKRNVLTLYLGTNTILRACDKHILTSLAVLLLATAGSAQLCSGSLGDPVVSITFGSGSNPGAALSPSKTNYTYTTTGCPPDGSYTIVNSTSGCFNNTWHTLTEDHTPGDLNGYMMLINASFNPGVFYVDTAKNLCSGTTYEFSAWIVNILKTSACSFAGKTPNITFNIESTTGAVIQTYSTGDIPNLSSPQWNQYGFYFTLPAGSNDVVIRMINNAAGGCGNDLVLDDIAFRPCGPKVDAAFANVNGNNGAVNFCISDNKVITLSGSVQTGFTSPAFQWQRSIDKGISWNDIPGETTTSYTNTYSAPGTFIYRLTAAEAPNIGIPRCRVASNQLTIIIDSIPTPNATSNAPVCDGSSLNLSSANAQTYTWTGPNGFTSAVASPVINPATPASQGKYYVNVITAGGCVASDSTFVIINPLPVADAGADASICQGKTTGLSASGGTKYSWTPVKGLSNAAIANPIAGPDTTTMYVVQVFDDNKCSRSDSLVITVLRKPTANAGPDKKIEAGQSVALEGKVTGDDLSWSWTPAQYIDNPSLLTPLVSPPVNFTYTLHVSTSNGCGDASDNVFVRVFQKITIPNAFSPNGDGINDRWVIDKLDTYPESVTEVYNRYGQLVFRSMGYSRPWDGTYNGKPLPVGTYYYIIDRKNGFPLLGSWVMIIR